MAPTVLLPRAVSVERECDIVKQALSSLAPPRAWVLGASGLKSLG